jgi:hypothetical protein
MATADDISKNDDLIEEVKNICGRFILNNVPTGVEVCLSMATWRTVPVYNGLKVYVCWSRWNQTFCKASSFSKLEQ